MPHCRRTNPLLQITSSETHTLTFLLHLLQCIWCKTYLNTYIKNVKSCTKFAHPQISMWILPVCPFYLVVLTSWPKFLDDKCLLAAYLSPAKSGGPQPPVSPVATLATSSEEPMQLGHMRLSLAKRVRRIRVGECFYCWQSGHFIAPSPIQPIGVGSPVALGILVSQTALSVPSPAKLHVPATLCLNQVSLPLPALIDSGAKEFFR